MRRYHAKGNRVWALHPKLGRWCKARIVVGPTTREGPYAVFFLGMHNTMLIEDNFVQQNHVTDDEGYAKLSLTQ